MEKNKEPNFIGIGTTRSGSTWIYHCLKEHPEICFSSKKETKFFNRAYNYRKGIDYYNKFFNQCSNHKIKGEFTSDYLLFPKTPDLIHKHFPNIKIIVCLRNPIEKIFSDYKYHVAVRNQYSIYKTFEELINKNPSFIEIGFYYKQLKRYFELFPRKNILVLLYEDIKKNPIIFLKNIYNFLGLRNKEFIPSKINEKINVSGTRTAKNRIPLINMFLYRFVAIFTNNHKFKNFTYKYRFNEILEKFLEFNTLKFVDSINNKVSNITLNEQTRQFLLKKYLPEIKRLEILLARKLDFWL